jgi:hypothetical protein
MFTKLEYLWLDGSPVTDRSIPSLARLKHLKGLGIKGTWMTESGVTALRRALPETNIHR